MTFSNYLQRRDPKLFGEMQDLGMDLNDPATRDSFVAQLQKDKVDLKKVAANVKANPQAKPDKAQMQVDRDYQVQQDVLAGKTPPPDVNPKDWQSALNLMVPAGQPAVPNLIGKGKPADPLNILKKAGEQGYLPQGAEKHTAPGIKMPSYKPMVNKTNTTPDANGGQPLTPSQLAKNKSMPSRFK